MNRFTTQSMVLGILKRISIFFMRPLYLRLEQENQEHFSCISIKTAKKDYLLFTDNVFRVKFCTVPLFLPDVFPTGTIFPPSKTGAMGSMAVYENKWRMDESDV